VKHNLKPAPRNFLLQMLEKFFRQNVYLYYWARKLVFWFHLITRTPHEKYFLILKKIPERSGIILDVGGNDGVSVISIRSLNKVNPIISLEPNPEHENRLRTFTKFIKNYQYIMVGAGKEEREVTLYTPVYKGFPLTAFTAVEPDSYDLTDYGMFTNNYDKNQLTLKKNKAKVVSIDSLNLNPVFVKIDVPGAMEILVLKGMLRTIKQYQPVIMIERGFSAVPEIQDVLRDFNYYLVNPETAEPVSEETVSDEPILVFWPASLTPLG
jgi:FkbM family methyltransferase